jgi:hypothetical protein
MEGSEGHKRCNCPGTVVGRVQTLLMVMQRSLQSVDTPTMCFCGREQALLRHMKTKCITDIAAVFNHLVVLGGLQYKMYAHV